MEDSDFLLFLEAPSCLSCCSKVVCSELCWFVSARLSVTESQNIKNLNGILNSLCSQKLVYTIINLLWDFRKLIRGKTTELHVVLLFLFPGWWWQELLFLNYNFYFSFFWVFFTQTNVSMCQSSEINKIQTEFVVNVSASGQILSLSLSFCWWTEINPAALIVDSSATETEMRSIFSFQSLITRLGSSAR